MAEDSRSSFWVIASGHQLKSVFCQIALKVLSATGVC